MFRFDTLRPKMMLGVLGPLITVLALFALFQYRAQRDSQLEGAARKASELSDIVKASLQHAMLTNNHADIQFSIDNISANPQVTQLFVLDVNGRVAAAAPRTTVGDRFAKSDAGCAVCHDPGGPPNHQLSIIMALPGTGRTLRNCNPIENAAPCHECHDAAQPYNGVLVTDLSLASLDRELGDSLRRGLLLLGGASLLGTALLGITMERLVIAPLRLLAEAMRSFGRGDLARRIRSKSRDEIGALAQSFDQMADGIEEKSRLEQQVHRHAAELERIYGALQEKEAARTRLLKQFIGAQEEERKHIARELHDEMAQSLTGLIMSVDATREVVDPGLENIHRQLTRTRDISELALKQTRQLILDLRPTMLDDLGLASAIRWYLEMRLGSTGTAATFRADGEQRRLPPELEIALFRIAQEAINNVARHAHARLITVRLAWEPARVLLQVDDDGQGFLLEPAPRPQEDGRGMGLHGMRERADMFGGTLEIQSEPGKGTHLRVSVPLTPEAREHDD